MIIYIHGDGTGGGDDGDDDKDDYKMSFIVSILLAVFCLEWNNRCSCINTPGLFHVYSQRERKKNICFLQNEVVRLMLQLLWKNG